MEKGAQNASEISTSLKSRNELAEKKISLLTYCKKESETSKHFQVRKEYQRLLRKQRLNALHQKVCSTERVTSRAIAYIQCRSFSNRADSVSAQGNGNEMDDFHISEQRDCNIQNADG